MIKLIQLLVEFGQSFTYTCMNSDGQDLEVDNFHCRIQEDKEGVVTVEYYGEGQQSEYRFQPDEEDRWDRMRSILSNILIQETT